MSHHVTNGSAAAAAGASDGAAVARCAWLRVCVCLLMLAGLAQTVGCGYSHKTLYPQEVSSVQVPIFSNRTFYRNVEIDLTEAVVKEIELRTPYKVVSDSSADTVLQGTVLAINQTRLSRRRDGGLPQEMEMQIVVDFSWRNLRTGQVLADRKGLTVVGRYVPPAGETHVAGEHEAVAKLATRIVQEMAGNW